MLSGEERTEGPQVLRAVLPAVLPAVLCLSCWQVVSWLVASLGGVCLVLVVSWLVVFGLGFE